MCLIVDVMENFVVLVRQCDRVLAIERPNDNTSVNTV